MKITARDFLVRPGTRFKLNEGTTAVKPFFKLENDQRKRFLERIDEPDKNRKFSRADVLERQYWPRYIRAYEACLSATSTTVAPWHVVPADDKENARLVISGIILDTMKRLRLRYPNADKARRKNLLSIRKSL